MKSLDEMGILLFLLFLLSQSVLSDPQLEALTPVLTSVFDKGAALSGNPTICQQLKANSEQFHKFMKNLTDTIKKTALSGILALGIKPLDPIIIPRFDYEYKDENYDIKGFAKDIKLAKHSINNITKLDTDILALTVDLELQIPIFDISGYNEMHGKLFKFFPIDGKGKFSIIPANFTLGVVGNATVIKDVLTAQTVNFTADFTGLDIHFDGVSYNGPGKEKLRDYISDFGVDLYHKMEPKFHETFRLLIVDECNKLLEKVPIKQIMGVNSVKDQKFPCPDN